MAGDPPGVQSPRPDWAPRWLAWAREIQSLAQTGLHYAHDDFELGRAQRLLEIAADIVGAHADLPRQEIRMAFSEQPGYVTPKVDVRGAVFRGDEILLVRESLDGGWTLPGGWADVGESPTEAVEREVREEAGLHVRVARLVGVYDANRVEEALSLFHAYKLVFLCQEIGGEPTPSAETSQVAFFPLDRLPEPFSAHRTTPRHVADAFAAHADPDRPAAFD
ncbi:MAG: NUDIX hydrolase N-terminal domain-containing protein [Chloroflexota bacterium]